MNLQNKSEINYDNRFFRSINNSASGEVSSETVFHYRQKGAIVWATYEGGAIKFGTLIARVLESGGLEMRYSHVNQNGELMTGECRSTPEVLPDGRIRLREKWQWTSGDLSVGESVIEEVSN
ncbi:MAG: n-acetylglutamate synthase [Pyrinomonadaceae bacterium]